MSSRTSPKTAVVAVLLAVLFAIAAEPSPNTWVKLDKATIEGRRRDAPLSYEPNLKRFLVLGGRTSYAEYKKPRSYDELALDGKRAMGELVPAGKDWGPHSARASRRPGRTKSWLPGRRRATSGPTGPSTAPFPSARSTTTTPTPRALSSTPAAGPSATIRPSGSGPTWRRRPTPRRNWAASSSGARCATTGTTSRFVLFGGGNIQSERGDPGTWTYTPADQHLDAAQARHAAAAAGQFAARATTRCTRRWSCSAATSWTSCWPTPGPSTWSRRSGSRSKPARSPSPRAGHALLWLPKAKKVLLLGGYSYTSTTGYVAEPLPPPAAGSVDLRHGRGPLGPADTLRAAEACPARAGERLPQRGRGRGGQRPGRSAATARGRLPARRRQDRRRRDGEVRRRPGAVERRTGPHDPAWYREGVPAADPAKVGGRAEGPAGQPVGAAADAEAAPAEHGLGLGRLRPGAGFDRAFLRRPLRLQRHRPAGLRRQDRPLHDPVRSGVSARIRLQQRPGPRRMELPGQPVDDRPHLQVHRLRSAPEMSGVRRRTSTPISSIRKTGKWSRSSERNPYRPNMYVVTLCATPQGAVVWADKRDGGGGSVAAGRRVADLESAAADGRAARQEPRPARPGLRFASATGCSSSATSTRTRATWPPTTSRAVRRNG